MHRLFGAIGFVFLEVLLAAMPLQAITYNWIVTTGNVNVSTNWTTNGVPGTTTADDAIIANGGVATISDSSPFAGQFRDLIIGTTAGNGAAVQAGSTISLNGSSTGGFVLGRDTGSYGGYNMSGGTLNLSGGPAGYASFYVGNNGDGVFSQTGGTVNVLGAGAGTNHSYAFVGAGAGTNSVMNLTGGQFIQRAIYPWGLWVGLGSNGVLNIGGTANVDLGNGGVIIGNGAVMGIVNVGGVDATQGGAGAGGGTLTTTFFSGSGTSLVNFHGGTIKFSQDYTPFGVTNAYVYSEGAVFDTNGKNIVINQNLEAPGGQGVTGVTLSGTGSGYIGEPIVTVIPAEFDTGVGATARAIMNSSGGIDHIVITNPGTGYNVAPTLSITGGGGTAPGSTLAIASNVSGGMTKTGLGSLTLTAPNYSYTGPTIVQQGTLVLKDVNLSSSAITVESAGTLSGGSSSISYPTTNLKAGGTIAPGGDVTNAMYLNGLNLANGSNLHFVVAGDMANELLVYGNIGAIASVPPGPITVNVDGTGVLAAGASVPVLTWTGTIDPSISFSLPGGKSVLDSPDGVTEPAKVRTESSTVYLDAGGEITSPVWNTNASGRTWSTPGNWGAGSTDYPHGGNSRGMFTATTLGGGAVPVSLNVSPQLSSMIFSSPNGESYTITPATGSETLKMNSVMAKNWHITVLSGDHTIGANIQMAAGSGQAAIRVADGSALTLSGDLSNLDSNAAGFLFEGNGNGQSQSPTYGTLKLEGLNTFTGPIIMTSYGRLEVKTIGLTSDPNALGQSGPAPANLQINGILAYTGTASGPTTVTTDRGFTLMGPLTDPNLGILNGIEVADAKVNLKFIGQLVTTGYSAFRKTGAGALTFANSGVNTLANCDFQVEEGTVVLDSGTFNKDRVNIGFQTGTGDVLVGDVASKTGALVLQNGATLNLTSTSRPMVGYGEGTIGSITLNDTSTIISASHTYFGWSGTGAFILNGSSRFQNSEHQVIFGLGNGASGSVALNGDGLSATAFPLFENVGAFANCYTWGGAGTTATISITNGTYTESGTMYVGVSTGGNGTLTLTTSIGSLAPATVSAGMLSIGGTYLNGDGTNSGAATGILTMTSGSAITVNGSMYLGQVGNGTATIGGATGSLATVGIGNDLYVGYMEAGHGELNVAPTGYVNMNQSFYVGSCDQGTTVGASGIVNNSGTIIKNANDTSSTVIGRAADSTFNQIAGSFTDGTIVCLGQWGNTGTINLNGGVFSTFSIQAGFWDDATAKGKINFDGGTLQANINSFYAGGVAGTACTLINPYLGTMDVFVKSHGAIIDTDGLNASVLVPLKEDSSSTSGGLTKIGEGTLNLVDGNTYTGDTIVNAGTLNVPNLSTPAAMVYVATGATLNATSIVADSLYIGGEPLPVGSALMSVPEPGTFVLLTLAGLAFVGAYFRRR